MIDIPSQKTMDWRRGEELNVLTSVVATGKARFAGIADDVGLNGDAVAGFQRLNGGVDGEDDTSGFVAEDVIIFNDHWADAAGMPEVDVRPAGSRDVNGKWDTASIKKTRTHRSQCF